MAREPEHLVARRRALGQALAARRVDKGVTQEDVSRATYCHRSSVGHIEQGDPRADEAFWKRADDFLDANGELLNGYKALELAKYEHEVQRQGQWLAQLRAKAEGLRAEAASLPAPAPLQPGPAHAVKELDLRLVSYSLA